MTQINSLKINLAAILIFIGFITSAQQQDSLDIYKKLKRMADKSKFTVWLYNSFFVDPKPKEYPVQPSSKEDKIVNPFLKYENHIIRNIYIKVYDPFGYSITDTTTTYKDFFQKIGNHSHITTRHRTIKNKLLFKKNEPLNALSLSETERLLREAAYVNDTRIFIAEIKDKDSIDVNVIVQDKWSVTAPLVLTDVSGNVRFRNQNILGLGDQFEQYIGFTRKEIEDYSGYYNISNISRTYISSQIFYNSNKSGTNTGISFDRPFYSPLTNWAGGISTMRSWKHYSYINPESGAETKLPLKAWSYDLWLGKSIKLNSKRKFFNQSTNIIVGERYLTNQFDVRPSFNMDTAKTIYNKSAFIGNIGFSVQQFYKDKFIYRFGINEDVPQGLIVQLLYGVEKKEFDKPRYYTGFEIARAKHFNLGYFSTTLSYGLFFNKFITNNITINYKLNYFSNLMRSEKWYFRQFINYKLVYGENKLPEEKIKLSPEELYGFESGELTGNSKMLLNLETVAYAPYSIIGFRFAPVFLAGLGMIGDKQNNLLKSVIYQGYSLGLMFRNENLLNSTFQISVGMYPYLPNGDSYTLKYNPVSSFTLRVRAFSVSKPDFISY